MSNKVFNYSSRSERNRVNYLAQLVWNYCAPQYELKESDSIIVLGSIDLLPAEKAAELHRDGYAPFVVFSGKGGTNSEKCPRWREGLTEARMLAEYAYEKGLSKESALLEEKSTNTAMNITNSRPLIERNCNEPVKRVISVHMPYASRRDKATWAKNWPEVEVITAFPDVEFERYHEEGFQNSMTREELFADMLGDFQRMFVYPRPEFDFIAAQKEPLPENVKDAYYELVDRGFTGNLLKDENGKIIEI